MDKSFEGLLFSLFIHAFLVWLIFFAKLPAYMPQQQAATEVTLIEEPKQTKKSKSFVTETNLKPKLEDVKDAADFLSQFTKRVKKQMIAHNNGPTQNAAPKQQQANQAVKAGGNVNPQHQEEGIGMPQQQAGSQAMHTVAIGASSIAEYVPGIDEGSFTALNTDQFTYYTFFARMNEQVRNRWVSMMRNYVNGLSNKALEDLSRRERQTWVEIVLRPDGSFNNALIERSSGETHLDQIPSEAFAAAAPFPNPPRGMIESDGMIHLKYAFVLQFHPPSFGQGSN